MSSTKKEEPMAMIAEAEESADSDLDRTEGKDQWRKRNRDNANTGETARSAPRPKTNHCVRQNSLKDKSEDSDTNMDTNDTNSVHSSATRTMDNTNTMMDNVHTKHTTHAEQVANAATHLQAYRDEDNDADASVASHSTWKTERSMQSHHSQLSARRESDRAKYTSMS